MLYLTMTFPENERQDGVLLAWSKGQMRVALGGCSDVVELREAEGQWTLDDGTPVELDGLLTDGDTELARLGELFPGLPLLASRARRCLSWQAAPETAMQAFWCSVGLRWT